MGKQQLARGVLGAYTGKSACGGPMPPNATHRLSYDEALAVGRVVALRQSAFGGLTRLPARWVNLPEEPGEPPALHRRLTDVNGMPHNPLRAGPTFLLFHRC